MPTPDITLQKGQVLVERTDSSGIGIIPQSPNLAIGVIVAVCDTCDIGVVGSTIMFKPEMSFGILSGAVYYIVNEKDILFKEEPLL
jgi:hypothetical protein